MPKKTRQLNDLVSVGPAAIRDFTLLGIQDVESLAKQDSRRLYEKLCKITGKRHDPCCEDLFAAAIAQAKDPKLSKEKCQWWYWSRVRKGEVKA